MARWRARGGIALLGGAGFWLGWLLGDLTRWVWRLLGGS